MVKVVKYICPYCHKAIEETKSERIVRIFLHTFAPIGAFTFILIVSLFISPIQTSNIVSKVVSFVYTFASNQNDLELREIALNLTKGCEYSTYIDVCNAIRIFEGLKDFNYQFRGLYSTMIYEPIYTYKTRTGDCLQLSMLYCALLSQVGGTCKLSCNYHHCWNVVKFENGDSAKIDLTIPKFEYQNAN